MKAIARGPYFFWTGNGLPKTAGAQLGEDHGETLQSVGEGAAGATGGVSKEGVVKATNPRPAVLRLTLVANCARPRQRRELPHGALFDGLLTFDSTSGADRI